MPNDVKPQSNRFITPPFVISYAHGLFKAQKNKFNASANPRFSCTAIWTLADFTEGNKKAWSAIRTETARQLKELFKVSGANLNEVQANMLKEYPKAWFALRSGTEAAKKDKPGYGPGTVFASLSSESPPGVIDINGTTIHPNEGNSDEIYSGAICRASITVKAYKHESGGVGYSWYLNNVQKIKDGKRIDNRVKAEDDFNEEVDGAWLDQADETAGEDTATDEAFE